MNRRRALATLVGGGLTLTAGCVGSLPLATENLQASAVFADYRYDESDLVVTFRDDVDVESVTLLDPAADEPYDRIDHPTDTVRFPVVFPDRLETYLDGRGTLRVEAETPRGRAQQWVWRIVHGAARNVEPLADGRARFELENQGHAPLLARFVAITGDVPNPTVDPQSESVDRSMLPATPGVVGVDENRPLTPSRSDLVVAPGETEPFETTYAPFAFPDGVDAPAGPACDGEDRRGTITVVHGSGGSAAYGFTFRLDGDPTSLEGPGAVVCGDVGPGDG